MAPEPDDMFSASERPKHNGRAILMLTADNVQDLEFFYPYYRFIEEGYRVDIATPKGGEFTGKKGMGLPGSKALTDVTEKDYDLLYIPGGKAPETLKKNQDALALVRRFAQQSRPIAAICHGPQILAAAGLLKGRSIAAWPKIEDEVTAAGADYVNAATVVDGLFITARWPGDLPSHMAITLDVLQNVKSQKTAAAKLAANA